MHINKFLNQKQVGEVSMEGYSQKFNLAGLAPLIAAVEYINERPLSYKVITDSNINEALKGLTNLNFDAKPYTGFACVATPILKNNDTLHKAALINVSSSELDKSETIGAKLRRDAKRTFDITVDTKNHWFTGPSVEDLTNELFLGSYMFGSGKLIPATTMQCVAVLLHEIGHVVGVLLGVIETATTCAYLADLSDELLGANDIKKKRIIIGSDKALASAASSLEKATTKEEIIIIALNEKNKEYKSKFGNNPLEYRNSEFLADDYLTKWGMGKYMIQFNDLVDSYGAGGYNQTYLGMTYLVTMIVAASAPILLPVFIPLALLADVAASSSKVDNYINDIYGIEGERINAIRKSMIARLKVAPDKNIVKKELKDLDEVEMFLDKSKRSYPLMYRLATSIFPGVSGRVRYRSAAVLAEDFANAEINIHIEKLRN
jgi:hypothetical protein